MTVAAAIDIGSNSVHLLVADVVDGASLATIADENLQLGLGLVVEARGRFGVVARRSATAAVCAFLTRAQELGAQGVLLMGTQPLRGAADRSLLRRAIATACGLDLDVISHEQEAALTLLGVTDGRPVDAPLLVMDVGGGSSEIILVGPGVPPTMGAFAVGSARLSASVVGHDPPMLAEVAELRVQARALVAGLPDGAPVRCIVSGGSGTNVSRLLGRERTTPVRRADLESGLGLLLTMRAADLAAATGLTERRVRQLAAGIAIVGALMDRYRLDVTGVSDAGLREGALLARARLGDRWLTGAAQLVGMGGARAAGNAHVGA